MSVEATTETAGATKPLKAKNNNGTFPLMAAHVELYHHRSAEVKEPQTLALLASCCEKTLEDAVEIQMSVTLCFMTQFKNAIMSCLEKDILLGGVTAASSSVTTENTSCFTVFFTLMRQVS